MESVTADSYPSPHSPDVALHGNLAAPTTPNQDVGPSLITDASHDELRTPSFDPEPMHSNQAIFLINTLAQVTKGGWYDSRINNPEISLLSETSQTKYKEKVQKPIDLNKIKSNLKSYVYASVDAFFGDIDLLVSNSSVFYGNSHTTTRDARKIRERLLAAMNRLPKQSDQVPTPITPKSEPSSTGKRKTSSLTDFFKPMPTPPVKKARGDSSVHGINTLGSPIAGLRIPDFFKEEPVLTTDGPVPPVAPMYHVLAAPPVARPLVPEDLVEAQKLMSTLTDAISKVSEAHPQMAQRISELDTKVSEATENVAQALSTMQGQMKAMEEMVAITMTSQQELQERCARLEDTVTSLESARRLRHTRMNETTRAPGGAGTYEGTGTHGGTGPYGVTGVYGGVGTREVVSLDGVQLPNNAHYPVFPYQLPTGLNPSPFPFV